MPIIMLPWPVLEDFRKAASFMPLKTTIGYNHILLIDIPTCQCRLSSYEAVYSRWASLKMFVTGASDVEKAKKQSSLSVLEDLMVAVPEDWSQRFLCQRRSGALKRGSDHAYNCFFLRKFPRTTLRFFWKLE
jgi:hypothetical protein